MRWTCTFLRWPNWAGLLLSLFLVGQATFVRAQGLVADSTELRVLHDFYVSTKGDQWPSASRTNWPTTPAAWTAATVASAATWTGIRVSNGDIIALDRESTKLQGVVPRSLGLLTSLTYLSMGNNPNLTGEIPATLGQLRQLTDLRLSNCALSGSLPSEVAQLTQLKSLDLTGNQFSGAIPAWLGSLANLTGLYLNDNHFTGPIPPELGQASSLIVINLSNRFEGQPGQGNVLTGSIPASLGKIPRLRTLILSRNPLTGTLPPELAQATNLGTIEVDGCRLSGAVPEAICRLPNLVSLVLGYSYPYPAYTDYNKFTSLPSPSVFPDLLHRTLLLGNNQFEFGTLEPYYSGKEQPRVSSDSRFTPQTLPQDGQTVLAEVGQAATIPSAIGGAHTRYQWQRQVGDKWLNLTSLSATTATYQLATAALRDAGTYRCQATNDWVTYLTLTTRIYTLDVRERGPRNLPDDTNRGLALATPHQPLDSAATQPADMNYVRTWVPRVALTTTGLTPAAATQAAADQTAAQAVTGTLLYEHWANVYGPADLDQLPLTRPADTQALTSFEALPRSENNYGARLRGYLLPPVTGLYTLYLSGDDVAQLWLSPDTNPTHASLIASLPDYTGSREWTKFPTQRALPVPLVAGQRYYVEVLHRQAGGGDGVAVAWVRPDQPGASPTAPIAGQFLAPAPVTSAPMAPNLVVNPSFDAEQQPSTPPYGWSVTLGLNTNSNASYAEAYGGGHTGAYHGTHYRPDNYEVYTTQTLSGLAPGTYSLRAWVRSNDGQSRSVLRARFYGGAAREVGLPAGVTDWVRLEIPNLVVSTGQCELGIYSKAAGGQALFFDDVAFTRQDGPAPAAATQTVALANPGFEADGQTTYAPQGWQVRVGGNTATAASYAESYGGAHTGAYHGTHYRPDAYEVYTYQTLTSLAAGTYTFRAWLRSSDGQSSSVLRGIADAGTVQQVGLPAGASEWTLVTLPNLVVRNGKLEVGVYSNATAGQALYFDDFTLERQLPSSTPDPTSADAPSWTVAQAQITTQYLDGLGRPVQTVLHQASPRRRDLVQPQAYDALGREPKAYLPFPADSTEGIGSYRHRALTQQQTFYNRTTLVGGGQGPLDPAKDPTMGVARTGVGYAETQFEASPLNRVLEQGAAGEAWQVGKGHTQLRLERPNVLTDSIPYLQVGYNLRGTDSNYQGFYPAGELWGTQTTDEQGSRTLEWKDKLGQVVLKQVESSRPSPDAAAPRRWLRTAYGYDDFQRLRVVLQPEGTKRLLAGAVPTSILPFTFSYRYDGRGRQIAKLVPGQDGETLVVYDQLDRPVLSQDASQRTRREWSWTKYDALGRAVLSGLVSRADTMGQVRLQALAAADTATAHQYEQRSTSAAYQYYSASQSFPQLGQQGFSAGQVLTATYYDDYDFDNNGQADAQYDSQSDGQFGSGAIPVADAGRTQGLTTGSKTRVLGVAESDPKQNAWLTTVTFYDERARPVQVQSTNARRDTITGKPFTDLLTTQLNFTGQVVQSVALHQGPKHQPVQVSEFFTYDHTGRLLTTRQQVPGEAQASQVAAVQYNELGQTTRKTLGTGRLTQNVDYAYNIRGWLTQLNDPAQPDPADLFNLSLHYETGFTKGYEQYNGNLTGQTWRGRDGVQRAYGYAYDPLNRLLQGDFVARAGGSQGTLSTATAWNQELDNYRLSFLAYDDNGNLNTLRRRSLLQNATRKTAKQYGAVDNLSYAYVGNRLQAVDDQVTGNQLVKPTTYHGAPTSLAGDFQEASVRLSQEYLYDANGNLTQDKNKGITAIKYNHLNLPRQIQFGSGADSVVFRYAASGQKVAKLVYQTGQRKPQRTDYLGPYQYEQDSLQFFPHAEGRVLRFVSYDNANQATVSYQREFTIKDHLGNLRLAYRLGQPRTLLATLEPDKATHDREVQQFDSLSVSAPVAQNVGTLAAYDGAYVAKLNAGGSTPQPLGPLTQLGVQKGDVVTVSAMGLYPQGQDHGFFFSLASFLTSLFHPAQPAPVGLEANRRKNLPLLQFGVAAGMTSLTQTSGVPLGYLRILVFNKDSVLVQEQTKQVQLSKLANKNYEQLSAQVTLAQDGYVTAYVGNESDVDVYFDQVKVDYQPGLLVQETQYDPAGLELAGLAAPSPGIRGLNNYRFNGKEFQADLGLAWNHQDWRFFDPQLLRWHAGDPELENGQESWTPYSFGYDNAVRYADANGREPDGPGRGVDIALGVLSAVVDDVLGTSLSQYQSRASSSGFQLGQSQGHVAMTVAGAYLMVSGASQASAGGTIVAGALVAEGASLGTATPVAAPTAAVGAVMVGGGLAQAGAGSWIAHNATRNLQDTRATDANGRVNASSSSPNANKTSGNNSASQTGRQAHKDFAAKLENKGWKAEVTMKGNNGKTYRVDGLTPSGNILELKPNTPRGRSRGASQAKTYERELGRKTRIVYY